MGRVPRSARHSSPICTRPGNVRGIEAIERTIDEHLGQYLKLIAMLMPKDMNVNVRPLDDMSDEQLLRRLQQLTELARPLLLPGRVTDIDPVTFSKD